MSSNTNAAIATFLEKFNRFKTENEGLISDLKTAIEERLDEVDGVLDDYAADLKTSLGADAANNAGDDEVAQESAISEVGEWVSDNVSNGSLEDRIAVVLWIDGCETGEATLRKHLPTSETVTVRLTLDVTYSLNGENATEMVRLLRNMCNRAIGEGMLTGESDAEVNECSVNVIIQPAPLSEDDVADFMLQRILGGNLLLEDIPVRLARYGLMESNAFIDEMRERMELLKADGGAW
jgi:hypothetical protein